jgi:hypothetical protein
MKILYFTEKEEVMNTIDRGRIIIAAILIGLGLLFLVFNLIPGYRMALAWPAFLMIVALAMLLPPFPMAFCPAGIGRIVDPGDYAAGFEPDLFL